MPSAIFESPFGPLTLLAGERGLRRLYFPGTAPDLDDFFDGDREPSRVVIEQLQQYFAGERTVFELPLDYTGTPFQRSVWDALRGIPYGTTTTYGALARALGAQPRAVGAAVGATPGTGAGRTASARYSTSRRPPAIGARSTPRGASGSSRCSDRV
jgi:methylated-DNA-[protein]-cysteine S-methyltransferase